VILTKRRNADDVFLIGEETLPDQDPDPRPDRTGPEPATAESLASPAAAPLPTRLPGSLHGARGFALLGLGAAAVATLGALELGGGGESAPVHREAPARSPLISGSAASAPTRVEVHRPSVIHHHRPRHQRRRRRRRAVVIHPSETVREPTQPVAPVSSPVGTTPPEPAPAPSVAVAPASPSPPPPSSGGGSGSVEQFGFRG
jgi:hypothetical protein